MVENIYQANDITKLTQLQYKKKPIIIEFYTEWCPPCKPCIALIEKQLIEVGGTFLLVKVNADEAEDLNMEYLIEGVPTTILLNNDNSINESITSNIVEIVGFDTKKIKDMMEKLKKNNVKK